MTGCFWRLPGAVDYRGDLADWPAFLSERLDEWSVTDIVLFGDCRPLHRAAINIAARRRIRAHVFEEGYLRPQLGYARTRRGQRPFVHTARSGLVY